MCLSFSIGGLILDKTISDPNLEGIVVFAPVINGKLQRVGSAFHKNVKIHLDGTPFDTTSLLKTDKTTRSDRLFVVV